MRPAAASLLFVYEVHEVDADLGASVDMLVRAIGIIEREMSKNAFLQTPPALTNIVRELLRLLLGRVGVLYECVRLSGNVMMS